MSLTENEIEIYSIDLLVNLGYQKANGFDIVDERRSNSEVILVERLKKAIERLNPELNNDAKEDALKRILRVEHTGLITNNEHIHHLLVDGVDVEYRQGDRIKGDKAWLIDFQNPENNEFLVVNQFTVIESGIPRRPDLILFINGIPLVIIELKNAASEKATVAKAYEQLQTYKNSLMTLFQYNAMLIVSDGMDARVGSVSSDWSRFMRWKSPTKQPQHTPEMTVMFQELLNKKTLIDFIKHFIVFEKDKKSVIKKLAAYHQYYAVNKAIIATKKASAEMGNRRCGVVWHTQGSGKSLSMVFYTGKLVLELDNPTVVILTDRNDLDDQLFATFSNCMQLLRQKPVQAEKRSDLQKLLSVASGGVVFTTIQKFFPETDDGIYPALTTRKNVIVVADEAHRSQYGFNKKIKVKENGQVIETYGMAKYLRDALPNASFIGFTGTPIELTDKSTPAVFGEYIDIYDIEQAVEDEATVRIYYESRLAKLHIKEEEKQGIDTEFEEITEHQEDEEKHHLKSRWAKVEAIVGSPQRLKDIAKDLVEHFETRTAVLDGKAMIVCMSRRICVEIYNEITQLRPDWHSDNDETGIIKVVMTGSASDGADWQKHIRNKSGRRLIADRMKDSENPLKLVIVRDMWLTGFDA
ncbi:MAG: type I restriction endonuclease subunit R, partial [Candidatus Sericytochromatia bacterium]|nr:type I restriction endonuclease subunit R [Candidatus Sericytochromatia bacterium]